MSKLIRDRDGSGDLRWFLDYRAVHCGTVLELRLPEPPGLREVEFGLRRHMIPDVGPNKRRAAMAVVNAPYEKVLAVLDQQRWQSVRFETDTDHNPVLYLFLGGEWEQWEPPPGHKEGDTISENCDDCTGSGQKWPGNTCERCAGVGARDVPSRDRITGQLFSARLPCGQCDAGKVTKRRDCLTCDGMGMRTATVQRPGPPAAPIHRFDLCELRWPKPERTPR